MKKPWRPTAEPGVMSGVIAASITPRRGGETGVDLAALLEVVDFLCTAGCDGIVLFGTTGEFLHFDPSERARALSLAVKRSRCPVYANVAHSTLDGAVGLADEAASAGAEAVLLIPPIYFRYDQETLIEFYRQFLAAAGGLIPAYLYNIPQFATAIEPATAALLIREGFAGIKDSSGDPAWHDAFRASLDGYPGVFLSGSELLYRQLRRNGAAGMVSGIASAVPELLVAFNAALASSDETSADRLEVRIREYIEWLNRFPAPIAIRESTGLRGLTVGPAAAPLGPVLSGAMAQFREWFGPWLKMVQAEAAAAVRR